MKALVLRSTEVDPDPRAERAIIDLQKAGFCVELLYWNRTRRNIVGKNESFSRKAYTKSTPYGLGLKNLKAQITWQFWVLGKLLKESNCLVYACDADTALVSAVFHRLRNHILVYDQFDQISSRFTSSLIEKLSDLIDRFISKKAKLIVVAGEDRLFKSKSDILVVSNNPDLPLSPSKRSDRGVLKISYCGVLQEDRGLFEIIDAVHSVDGVRLNIAGYGPLQGEIESRQSNSVKFLGRLSSSEVIKEFERADISYAVYDPNKTNNRYAASSKLYESAISCTPCIVSDGTNLANIVRQFDVGWPVAYGDRDGLRALLKKLVDSDKPLILDFDEKRRQLLKSHSPTHQHLELVKSLAKLKEDLS
jgi:glycosyltransferase involved in cell wall biosynthesis